jgi:hypothetical protein
MILPGDSYTYTPQLGLYFLSKGFRAEIVTFNPYMFTHKDSLSGNPVRSIEEYYQRVKNKKISVEIKRPAKFFVSFVENGGRVVVKVPDEEDIRMEIKHKRPLLALLTTNFLYQKPEKAKFNFHANVVTGIDNELPRAKALSIM